MRYPPSILDDIRARLPVSAVVGRRVKLVKAGREWKGLSPFNAEKSPSFFVNDQKGFFHDFSSGKNGDIFKFLMETEGVSFPEAVERLAADAGVILPKMSVEAEEQEVKRTGLHQVMALAQEFFQAQLMAPAGAQARAYLDGRGMGRTVWAAFGIGFAPNDRHALQHFLTGKGVLVPDMIEAGLLIAGEDIPVPYDRFRNRVMFPICDSRGRPIAFGGRALDKDAPAKYLNSPDTPLFHKGDVLFNHHNARKAAHDTGRVIAVEGYVDVIAMSVTGFAETVAPLGTALTENQLALLWRMCDEPILCFDGDKAGRRAAWRAIDTALPHLKPGKSLRFALLPEGQDPDDLARSGGKKAIDDVLDRATSLVDLLWARELEKHTLDTPERRAAFERDVRIIVSSLKDEDLRRHYKAEIDQRMAELMPSGARRSASQGQRTDWTRDPRAQKSAPFGGRGTGRAGGNQRATPFHLREPARASQSLTSSPLFSTHRSISPREAFILAVLASRPDLLGRYADELANIDFASPDSTDLARALADLAALEDLDTAEQLRQHLQRAGLEQALIRIELAVRPGDRRCLAHDFPSIDIDSALKQAMILHRRAITLHKELMDAERALAENDSESNLAVIRDLQLQLSALDGMEADRDRLNTVAGAGSDQGLATA